MICLIYRLQVTHSLNNKKYTAGYTTVLIYARFVIDLFYFKLARARPVTYWDRRNSTPRPTVYSDVHLQRSISKTVHFDWPSSRPTISFWRQATTLWKAAWTETILFKAYIITDSLWSGLITTVLTRRTEATLNSIVAYWPGTSFAGSRGGHLPPLNFKDSDFLYFCLQTFFSSYFAPPL